MASDHLLDRLKKTANPPAQAAMRQKLLRRIEGAPIRRIAQQVCSGNRIGLRSQVLSRIAHPTVTTALSGLGPVLSPPWETMESLREEVLCRIALWQPAPAWRRALKPVAVVAAMALLIRMTPTLFIATPLQAETQNIVLTERVSVTDGAEWSTFTENFVLDHPATLRTENATAATVSLGDTSVWRMGENAELTLLPAAFDANEKGPIARISYGQVWITSMLPEALFAGTTVLLPQGMLALKDGSVSVFADPQQSTVQVFHRFARVLPTGSDPIHLIEGDQLTLLPNNETQRHLITENLRQQEWVKINLSRDAVHRTDVAERKQEYAETAAGILPTSTFYALKRASETLDLWMTLSGKSRQVKKLQHAKTRLNEAVALLSAGESQAAESPLADYREAIHAFASLSEKEARELLHSSLLESTSTVSFAFPHSELFAAKKAVLEVATEVESAEIPQAQVDLYLLSDALLGIETLIAQGELSLATATLNGIEGAIESVLRHQELDGAAVAKTELKTITTILRSISFSLEQAEEFVKAEKFPQLTALQSRIEQLSPTPKNAVAVVEEPGVCMTVRERMRRTNQFLAAVYTYQTPVGQRNAVLQQIASLPNCAESAQILAKVMNKVPVFTRSFVWEALQEVGSAI
jgi:hypothetical protein